ncbi:helix-turn-helix domain-containing protein [Agromyces sp. NPDC056523]|uniref:helix-turn-helix domain-containing protein n=1 Tax=Agromyces sp. NPDC056523 TaxID=3345850 RepID=UPI003670CACB
MGRLVVFPSPEAAPRAAKPLWRHVLGEVLRGERLEQERILTEVAATAGVSPQYLSEVERGRKEASSEVLGAVAEALGLELGDVVARVAGRLAARTDDRRTLDLREVHGRRADAPRPTRELAPGTAPPSGLVTGAFLLAA